jgi:hypothetical protein
MMPTASWLPNEEIGRETRPRETWPAELEHDMPDMIPDTPDVLARICADTRAELALRQAARPLSVLKSKISARRGKPRGFGGALKQALMWSHSSRCRTGRHSPCL